MGCSSYCTPNGNYLSELRPSLLSGQLSNHFSVSYMFIYLSLPCITKSVLQQICLVVQDLQYPNCPTASCICLWAYFSISLYYNSQRRNLLSVVLFSVANYGLKLLREKACRNQQFISFKFYVICLGRNHFSVQYIHEESTPILLSCYFTYCILSYLQFKLKYFSNSLGKRILKGSLLYHTFTPNVNVNWFSMAQDNLFHGITMFCLTYQCLHSILTPLLKFHKNRTVSSFIFYYKLSIT